MGVIFRRVIKPILFKFDPEYVHDKITVFGAFLGSFSLTRKLTHFLFSYSNRCLSQTVFGIKFSNPIGLSAGFDKNAQLVNILPSVGFGFAEVGTVTARAYEGNPRPRLFRLPKSQGIVVNYGLKNIGADRVMERVKARKDKSIPQIISIGKTNSPDTVELNNGIVDYENCLDQVIASEQGDIYEINISCPNAFGGEPFTTPEKLEALLTRLFAKNIPRPVLLKMPINVAWPEFEKLLAVAVRHGVAGVVIGNVNKDRNDPAVSDVIPEHIKGSISGLPTKHLANELIAKTYKSYGDRLKIVGVGGIFSAEDAYEKIKLGASLVELITGMIFKGPSLIGDINRELVKYLERDGYNSVADTIGTGKPKKVLVFGVFDELHEGHKFFLSDTRKHGELVIAVARDSVVRKIKNKAPIHHEFKRAEALRQFLPDAIVVLGDETQGGYEVVKSCKPDIICLGYDQKKLGDDLRQKMRDGILPQIPIKELKAHKPEQYKSNLIA